MLWGSPGRLITAAEDGYLYDVVTNLLVVYPKIYDGGDYASGTTGVAYRTRSGEGTNEVVVDGLTPVVMPSL